MHEGAAHERRRHTTQNFLFEPRACHQRVLQAEEADQHEVDQRCEPVMIDDAASVDGRLSDCAQRAPWLAPEGSDNSRGT